MNEEEDLEVDAAIEAEIDEYQRKQRPSLRQSLQAEYTLREMQRVVVELSTWRIEQLLKDADAGRHLQRLQDEGCDRQHLLYLLAMVEKNELPERWLGLKSRSELKTAMKKVADAMHVIRTVQPSIWLCRTLARDWAWFAMFPMLETLLQSYLSFLALFGDSKEAIPDVSREFIVAHVVNRTGTAFDHQVAALIAALPGHGGYSTEAHAKWRSRSTFLRSGASWPT